MRNIRDWCISRQLWWGHRIPVWYCEECDGRTVEVTDPVACAHSGGADRAEAGATGAGTMVTACPKCLIHFECTKTDPNLPDESRVTIKDLTVIAAEAL